MKWVWNWATNLPRRTILLIEQTAQEVKEKNLSRKKYLKQSDNIQYWDLNTLSTYLHSTWRWLTRPRRNTYTNKHVWHDSNEESSKHINIQLDQKLSFNYLPAHVKVQITLVKKKYVTNKLGNIQEYWSAQEIQKYIRRDNKGTIKHTNL